MRDRSEENLICQYTAKDRGGRREEQTERYAPLYLPSGRGAGYLSASKQVHVSNESWSEEGSAHPASARHIDITGLALRQAASVLD